MDGGTDEFIDAVAALGEDGEARYRHVVLRGDEGRARFSEDVRRLELAGWDHLRAVQFSLGLLPGERKRWFPKAAYRSGRISRTGRTKEEAISDTRDWLSQWFYSKYGREEVDANDKDQR